MTVAQISQITYPSPQTADGMASALATAFTNAGFGRAINAWTATNGDIHNTFSWVGNATVTKGTIFLDTWVTNQATSYAQRQLYTAMYDTWDTSSHSGTNGAGYSYAGVPVLSFTNGSIILTSISHPELHLISVQQAGYGQYFFGIIRPATKPSWWDENVYPYFFMNSFYALDGNNHGNLTFFHPLASTLNPYNNSNSISYMRDPALKDGNLTNFKRDLISGLTLTSATNTGSPGQTSQNIVLACANNASFLDVFAVTPGSEEYTLITPGGSPGIAIRTV